jgi:hypothetical protein
VASALGKEERCVERGGRGKVVDQGKCVKTGYSPLPHPPHFANMPRADAAYS